MKLFPTPHDQGAPPDELGRTPCLIMDRAVGDASCPTVLSVGTSCLTSMPEVRASVHGLRR